MSAPTVRDLEANLLHRRACYVRARRLIIAPHGVAMALSVWLLAGSSGWPAAILGIAAAASLALALATLGSRRGTALRHAFARMQVYRREVATETDAELDAGREALQLEPPRGPEDHWAAYQRQRVAVRIAIADGDAARVAAELMRLDALSGASDPRMAAGTAVTRALLAAQAGADPVPVLAAAGAPLPADSRDRRSRARDVAIAATLIVCVLAAMAVISMAGIGDVHAGVATGAPERLQPGATSAATLRAATDRVRAALAAGQPSAPEPLTEELQRASQTGDPVLWWLPDAGPSAPGLPAGSEVVEVFVRLGDFQKTGEPIVILWTGPTGAAADRLVRVRVDAAAMRQVSDLLVRP